MWIKSSIQQKMEINLKMFCPKKNCRTDQNKCFGPRKFVEPTKANVLAQENFFLRPKHLFSSQKIFSRAKTNVFLPENFFLGPKQMFCL